MRIKLLIIGLIAAVVLTAGSAVGFIIMKQNSYLPAIAVEGNRIAPDFTLTDQNGNRFTLSEAKGKVVLMFFGYTNCPDECPIVMSKYAALAKGLGNDANNVVMLFITTDPKRDSQQAIKTYIERFHPRIIGLTGEEERLKEVWQRYNVPFEYVKSDDGKTYYVSHFSLVLVADKNQVVRFAFTPEMNADEYIRGVRSLL